MGISLKEMGIKAFKKEERTIQSHYCLIRADKTRLDGSSWKGWGEPCGKGEVFNILEYYDIFLFSSVLWEGRGF